VNLIFGQDRRIPNVYIFSAFLLLVIFSLHIACGTVFIPLNQVWRAIFSSPTHEYQRTLVWNLRIPRTLISITAGGMLGLAGVLAQRVTRNSLADPGLIGVSSGSILGIVICMSIFPATVINQTALPFASILGAIGAVGLIYFLTNGLRSGPFALTLQGIVLSAVLGSISSILLIHNNTALDNVLQWMIGSLNGKVWVDWNTLWPWALCSIPVGFACTHWANVMRFHDDVAIGLGVKVQQARLWLFIASAFLTAGAVAIVGDIWFIGLVGPHIARKLVGHNARHLLPVSALISAILLSLADLSTQVLPQNLSGIPDGAVTALLGAPFFLYLLLRKQS
jgi:iron complex transport system permease protein